MGYVLRSKSIPQPINLKENTHTGTRKYRCTEELNSTASHGHCRISYPAIGSWTIKEWHNYITYMSIIDE